MTTPQKAAANAANARHSTGPVSAGGKARSSRNAVKHGLTAAKPIIPPDRRQDFDQLEAELREELSPQGPIEGAAFDQLVHAAWKQRLIRDHEASLLMEGPEALVDEATAETLDRLQRYGAAADRAFYRALKELRALQTECTLRGTIRDEIAALIPTLATLPAVSKQQAANRRATTAVEEQDLKALDAFINAPIPAPFPWDKKSGPVAPPDAA
jgi:hypothetical protein